MPYKDPEVKRARERERVQKDPVKRKARQKTWRQNNQGYVRDYRTKHLAENPGYHKGYNLKTRYNLSLEAFQAMLKAQGGLCGICNEPMKSPCVDHDHVMKVVRGLLCHNCNLALGQMQDDPRRLEQAARYLRRHQTPESFGLPQPASIVA